jgi:hypothetical protein
MKLERDELGHFAKKIKNVTHFLSKRSNPDLVQLSGSDLARRFGSRSSILLSSTKLKKSAILGFCEYVARSTTVWAQKELF